ncbi:universal stress protein [Nonomuraea sp. NPDC048916]|uniref:universal stress protein n=1 Tax=Nonomuraea sp. NPDC048916 TaxID=3154232 RepID=UPI0033D77A39
MRDRDGGRPVLVGYDESPGSEQALRWATEEARLRDLPVLVCHTWHWPYAFRPVVQQILEQVERVAATVVEDGVRRVRELDPGLEVRPLLAKGAPSAVLLQAACQAELVVLGSRGQGGFEDLRVGSAAVQVPAHSVRPVIVVRPTLPAILHDGVRIVAGVDGSPASRAAIEFAMEEAALRGGTVKAICCWWDPGTLPGPDRLPFVDPQTIRKDVEVRFREAVSPLADRYPDVSVTTEFVAERPQRAMVEAAKGTTLLVLGNRGLGSAPSTLLGSVTQAVLSEAPCPIAVTPPPS